MVSTTEGATPQSDLYLDLAKPYRCLAAGCEKAFARRSDLARHERIHSGHKPHACTWEGCSKKFIQKSALTVHYRVHTKEKPHKCEQCGKAFSDSSSLARHRRIHSGKRPFKCPFADCQKTFTRNTTLTRHLSKHEGTMEEAEIRAQASISQIRPNASQLHAARSPRTSYIDAAHGEILEPQSPLSTSISPQLLPFQPHIPTAMTLSTSGFQYVSYYPGRNFTQHVPIEPQLVYTHPPVRDPSYGNGGQDVSHSQSW